MWTNVFALGFIMKPQVEDNFVHYGINAMPSSFEQTLAVIG